MINLKSKEPKTVLAIKKRFGKLSNAEVIAIDKRIKAQIANDDSYIKIKSYVQQELQGKKPVKFSFYENCSRIADEYKKNSDNWMSQENLFCFLAVLISFISMAVSLTNMALHNNSFSSNTISFCIYFTMLVVFCIMDATGLLYRSDTFNTFIRMLNRYSPVLVLVGTALFYGCICAAEQPSVLNGLSSCLFIRVLIDFGMLTGLSTPLLAIINTLFKMPKSKK